MEILERLSDFHIETVKYLTKAYGKNAPKDFFAEKFYEDYAKEKYQNKNTKIVLFEYNFNKDYVRIRTKENETIQG